MFVCLFFLLSPFFKCVVVDVCLFVLVHTRPVGFVHTRPVGFVYTRPVGFVLTRLVGFVEYRPVLQHLLLYASKVIPCIYGLLAKTFLPYNLQPSVLIRVV